ncbi:hypothetical protein L6452_18749 [Arctium lappa]|uniref:Uncharacterized protein n=1 Tax=Arctium lappa TaxID=4217 RepID=A0ACB9C739_ARCLA|nr:hypothetical protein L6452_18749 [Arctium lappa]
MPDNYDNVIVVLAKSQASFSSWYTLSDYAMRKCRGKVAWQCSTAVPELKSQARESVLLDGQLGVPGFDSETHVV